MEGPTPVVPPSVESVLSEALAEHVDHSEVDDAGQGRTFGRCHMGRPLEGCRIPDVPVVGSHIEVADYHHRGCGRVDVGGQIVVEASQPVEFVTVVIVVNGPSVRYVARGDPYSATGGPQDAGVRIRVVAPVVEPGPGVDQPHPGDHCHTVPATLPVVGRLVPEGLEGPMGEGLVGHLGLLEAEHVGLGDGDPGLHPGQAGFEGVDVPGGDAHGPLRVAPAGQPRGKPTRTASSVRAWAGSNTLMVAIPMARAGLRLTPRSSRNTHDEGVTPSC